VSVSHAVPLTVPKCQTSGFVTPCMVKAAAPFTIKNGRWQQLDL
jgi:hypothetical protein